MKDTRGRTKPADLSAVWKSLILFNILATVLGFWMIYSQNNYILEAVEKNMPLSIPEYYKGTAVVVNPFTGRVIAINSFTLTGTLMGFMVLFAMYFLLRENL